MPYDKSHIVDWKGLALKVDTIIDPSGNEVNVAGIRSAGQLTVLTDSTGGAADNTLAAVPAATAASTDTSAASLASTNTALTAIKNDLADLAAKVNAIINALKS